ncbi:MAG TPA: phage tail protein, partial [Bryobacteraceae bacterium]|nr:phage tail protein [Bryobacteraceae bacterium]
QCNLVLQSRRSGGDVVRGIRNAARLYLTYGTGGVLQLRVENTAALEQPAKPANSNSTAPLDGGWPSYEFGDGSNGFTGILRRANREPSVVVSSRGIADTPNRITVEFQDDLNGYQQDSYSMVDPEDVARAGQEVAISLKALGLPNYDQAARILKFNLDKSIRGNTYIEFQTSVRALGIRPGDLVTVTYLKEGFNRQPFRVLKIAPATNYRTSTITAQIHDDAWYADTNGQTNSPAGAGHQANAGVGIPRPLVGSVLDENSEIQFGVVETAAPASDGSTETSVSVSFVPPAVAAASGPGVPLISLITTLGTGGSLDGGQVLYYAVSGVDDVGQESVLSFLVRAAILSNASTVTLSGLSFAPGTASFHVYRGNSPALLFRIASDQALAGQFTDTGFAPQLVAPPDPHFDHANFYWRRELEPELAATIHSPTTVGNSGLRLDANAYRGMTARITRGPGAGQERIISSNDATVLTVAPPWTAEPDAASFFVVAEAGWHFGAQTRSSPVEFPVPNRSGEVVQITGRSANVNDLESAPELAVVTRWVIGGSGGADTDVPPAPSFGFSAGAREGFIEVSGVSFADLANTRSISSATLTVYYWDELQPAPATLLGTTASESDAVLNLSAAGPAEPGSLLQLEAEVLRVGSVEPGGLIYHVTRGIHGSTPAAHAAGTPVYHLLRKTSIAPFPPDFFGSPYCGNWSYSTPLPDARAASAELFVTNRKGNSPPGSACLTGTVDRGLRTLSGGQYSIQVEGYLAVAQSAAPALVVDTVHAVRDIFAVVGKAADGPIQLQLNLNGEAYCQLTIPAAQFVSNSIGGSALPPLPAGAQITLAVLAVGQTYPGADLTVVIRL